MNNKGSCCSLLVKFIGVVGMILTAHLAGDNLLAQLPSAPGFPALRPAKIPEMELIPSPPSLPDPQIPPPGARTPQQPVLIEPVDIKNIPLPKDAKEQFELALKCLEGKEVIGSINDAIQLFMMSAQQNYAPAQYYLGYMYQKGYAGQGSGYRNDIKWYRLAAEQNYADAQYRLGKIYIESNDQMTKEEGLKLIRKAAENNSPNAQDFLAREYYYDGGLLDRDIEQSIKWYLKLAENNNAQLQDWIAHIQYWIAKLYLSGNYLPKNESEAFKWCKKAAENNHIDAQFLLGTLYINGLGTKQDYAEALKWIKSSANKGNKDAKLQLGIMYFEGKGVKKDYSEACYWFTEAKDIPKARYYLGLIHEEGYGVEKNNYLAGLYYGNAAKHNIPEAQYRLAIMFNESRGVLQDDVHSYAWLLIATANGIKDDKGLNTKLIKVLSPQERDAAKDLARKLFKEIVSTVYPSAPSLGLPYLVDTK